MDEGKLKDRDRVIVFHPPMEGTVGDMAMGPQEEARGILISIKDDKAYILPDGMKTIKVWPLSQVSKEAGVEDKMKAIIVTILTFLADYYIQQGRSEEFSPVGRAKLECVNYLLLQEGGKDHET